MDKSHNQKSPGKKLPPEAPIILVDGVRPASVNKRRAALYIGSSKLIEKMLWAARHQPHDPWIVISHNQEGRPKATTLIDSRSLEGAYLRLRAGEEPPSIQKLVHIGGSRRPPKQKTK